MKQHSYTRHEKLKSRKQTERLFAGGKSLSVYPVRVFYRLIQDNDFFAKAGVGATKKNFKKATDRNRAKRLLREAYRLNKQPLYDYLKASNRQVLLFFLLTGKAIPAQQELMKTMAVLIDNLVNKLHETTA